MIYVGIDLAKNSFVVTALTTPQNLVFFGLSFVNTPAGFQHLISHFLQHHITPDSALILMESTGVYGDKIRHFLYKQGFQVCVEPAVFIRRAFRMKRKTDPVDSRMIAEYGVRYADQVHPWHPQDALLEQIQVFLVNRELLIKERTAHKNIKKALAHKENTLAHFHQDIIQIFDEHIATINKAIQEIIKPHPQYRQHFQIVKTIPGCGAMFAANLFVLSQGFQNLDYKALASYCGIVPHEYSSGQRIYKRPRSDRQGPDRMRKVLHMCAVSAIKPKDSEFRKYFLQKTTEGKPAKLVLNNIRNKLLRLACALLKSGKPYNPKHKSF